MKADRGKLERQKESRRKRSSRWELIIKSVICCMSSCILLYIWSLCVFCRNPQLSSSYSKFGLFTVFKAPLIKPSLKHQLQDQRPKATPTEQKRRERIPWTHHQDNKQRERRPGSRTPPTCCQLKAPDVCHTWQKNTINFGFVFQRLQTSTERIRSKCQRDAKRGFGQMLASGISLGRKRLWEWLKCWQMSSLCFCMELFLRSGSAPSLEV